jgi:hypothetical protein
MKRHLMRLASTFVAFARAIDIRRLPWLRAARCNTCLCCHARTNRMCTFLGFAESIVLLVLDRVGMIQALILVVGGKWSV